MTASYLRCLIVEDEPLGQKIIIDYINAMPELRLVAVAGNAFEATAMLDEHKPDLIFLDINLPQFDGLSWLQQQEGKPISVILTTANPNYALRGFDLNVVDYLLKPFSPERFQKAVSKVIDTRQVVVPTDYYVKEGLNLTRVDLSAIRYIEGMDDYTQFNTINAKLLSTTRLHQLEIDLPSPPFYRINRSTIVNLRAIKGLTASHVVLDGDLGDLSFTVSAKYRDQFLTIRQAFTRQ